MLTAKSISPVLAFALVAVLPPAVRAACAPGENLLTNGRFEADQADFPPGWMLYPKDSPVPIWNASGGPNGMPSVTLSNPGGTACDRLFGQQGLKLAEEGVYRISAWVRPRAFKAKEFALIVVNAGWGQSRGLRHIDAPEGKWTRVSADFQGFKSKTGFFNVHVWTVDFSGEVDIADFRLEPLNDAACRFSERKAASAYETEPRIVPWGTLLGEIRKDTRKASFRFLGKLQSGTVADCDLVVADEASGQSVRARLESPLTTVVLPPACTGGVLRASVVRRSDLTAVCSRECRYRVTDVPRPGAEKRWRRLNNLVTELLSEELSSDGPRQLSFSTPRRGWVFLSVQKAVGGDVSVTVDGETVLTAETPRRETVRLLPRGDHAVVAKGGGRLVVRAIPEIFDYSPYPSHVPENPKYDWSFQERYVLPAATTLNGADVPEEFRPYLKRGYAWVDNMNVNAKMSAEELDARFRRAKGLREPGYAGTSADELYLGSDEANRRYLEALARLDRETQLTRSVYTWVINKPLGGDFDAEFVSGCLNAGLGCGKILMELYARTKESEADAHAFVSDYVVDSVRRYRRLCPESMGSVGAILANFAQLPVLSVAHDPEVDFKAYLDMQVEALATAPEADGLGLVGYWGTRNGDEETVRWSFMLMRHYCVNGRTEPLRKKFRLAYRPGHLADGDFRRGLSAWRAEGDIVCDAFKGLGWNAEGRHGTGSTAGDTFAVLKRGKSPNCLSQRARGLEPGRTYCLQCCTFDVDDMKNGRAAPRPIELSVSIGTGGERVDRLSWHHVDRRKTTFRDRQGKVGRVNVHHIVFRATAGETEIAIDDVGASEGMRLGVNGVSLNPYVPADWAKDVESWKGGRK